MTGGLGNLKRTSGLLFGLLLFTFLSTTVAWSQNINDVVVARDAVDRTNPGLFKSNPDLFIQSVAERLYCVDRNWGRKRTTSTSPTSLDKVSYNLGNGRIHSYDLISSVGAPNSTLQLLDEGVLNQSFVAISAQCGVAPPPPGPIPGPDPIERHDEQLQQIREDVARIRYLLEEAGKRLGIQ